MNNKKISIAARALAMGMVAALVLVGTAMGGVSRTGLVGEWHFDGDAKDSSGNGNDGTIVGATFVDGISGKALSFNGKDNYVTATDNGFSSGTSPKTVSAWIKADDKFSTSYGGAYGMIFGYGAAESRTNMFFVGVHSQGNIIVTQYGDSYISSGDEVFDKWHNIAVTYDGKTYKTYIDGVQRGSKSMPTNTMVSGNSYIGDIPGYSERIKYSGIIDEVRIYNRALSDSEIKSNYEASKAPPPPQLTLTKSLSPSTITEGDSTTVTIRVENTGGDAKSVKITDTIPQGFTLVSGSASQEYAALKATESRTFQYTIKATGTGRFVSDLATVTYQDDKGNSYSGASNSATITVQASASAPQQQATAQPQQQAPPAAQPKTPGFGAILAGIGMILALALRRR